MKYDIIIIGAGLVGLATAYKLQELYPHRTILILEKEEEVASHQSGRNSGVIHSGIYYKPNSQKAILCRKGYDDLLHFCDQNLIPYEIKGKLVVATHENELETLYELERRAANNNIQNCKIIDASSIQEAEPYIHGIKALYVPKTGVIDFNLVAKKLAYCCIKQGLTLVLANQVTSIRSMGNTKIIQTNKNTYETDMLINCAGLFSDIIAKIDGVELDCSIIPFKGDFYKFKPSYENLVNGLVYPVPDLELPFLGIHFTKGLNGHIECGPNAIVMLDREGYQHYSVNLRDLQNVFCNKGFYRFLFHNTKYALHELQKSLFKEAFVQALQKFMPDISQDMLVRSYSGIRAQLIDGQGKFIQDFMIHRTLNSIHVLNAPSPAATSCFAIGEYIAKSVTF